MILHLRFELFFIAFSVRLARYTFGKFELPLCQRKDILVDRAAANELHNRHRLCLADPITAVRSLLVVLRIEVLIKQDHPVGGNKIDA